MSEIKIEKVIIINKVSIKLTNYNAPFKDTNSADIVGPRNQTKNGGKVYYYCNWAHQKVNYK